MRIAYIQKATAERFGVTVDDLKSPSKRTPFVWPRFIAMKIARDTGCTYPQIAFAFGDRDHTSVMNACRRVDELMNEEARVDIAWIKRRVPELLKEEMEGLGV